MGAYRRRMKDSEKLPSRSGTPYAKMSRFGKIKFIAKLALCILTFGMAFPNVMSD